MKYIFGLILLLLSQLSVAANQPNVTINAWLTPLKSIVVGQQVDLYVEVATDSWLTKVSQLSELEIPRVISLASEQSYLRALSVSKEKHGRYKLGFLYYIHKALLNLLFLRCRLR